MNSAQNLTRQPTVAGAPGDKTPRSWRQRLTCWSACLLLGMFCAWPARALDNVDVDATLAAIYDAIEAGLWQDALEQTNALIRRQPNYRLAWLIRGDLLQARAQPLTTFGAAAPPGKASQVNDLRDEAIARLLSRRERPPANAIPRDLLQLSPQQRYALVIDAGKSRLYVFRNENGAPRLAADYYFTQGRYGTGKRREGDQRTPVGVYRITGPRDISNLPNFYGSGVWPLDYPNAWDKRLGRRGHGIWLHGTPPDTFSRPPKASDGCVVMSNADLQLLSRDLQNGATPVLIGEQIEWLSPTQWQMERKPLLETIDAWRRDFEHGDAKRMARFYVNQVEANKAHWATGAITVNTVLRAPGKEGYVVVDLSIRTAGKPRHTLQYWAQQGGGWKIVLEG